MIIFGVDVMVPLGVGICFLYLETLMFLAMYSSPNQSSPVIVTAAFSAMLAGIGFFLSPPGPIWHAMANRSLAISLIGTTVILSLMRKQAETEVKVLRGLLPICSYCKKIRDDGGYWQQVERYIAARSAADFSHGMCPDCGAKHFPDLYREKATKSVSTKSLGLFGKQEP
jgi:hypothetical protein